MMGVIGRSAFRLAQCVVGFRDQEDLIGLELLLEK
jgi:hypothetical protein